jgi:hypothetical protein
MSLRLRTERRTGSNALSKVSAKPFLYLVGLISVGTLLVSCATPDVLGDKEESARRSGKGAVIGIHQGLDSIDDPVVTKWRAVLLDDEAMQRMVTQLVRAAVVGARQGISEMRAEEDAAAITDAIATTLDRHLEQTGGSLLRAVESTAYSTTVRTVRDSILVAASSFEVASPRFSAGMRSVVESSIEGALDVISARLEKKTGELIKDELPLVVSVISRTAAREAVRGFKQGLTEEFPEFFPRPQFWTDWVRIALVAGSTVLFVLLVVAGIVIVQLARSYRLGTQALYILAQKVEQHGSPELKAAISGSTGPNGAESWLAEFLRKRGA